MLGLALGGLLTFGLGFKAQAWETSPLTVITVQHRYRCAAKDHPEPKLQGQVPAEDQGPHGEAKNGYNCGLELIGHNDLSKTADGNDTRRRGNANMAWAGDCAFVSGNGAQLFNPPVVTRPPVAGKTGDTGVAVVDVHDPAKPRMVKVLRMPGAMATSETIGARTRSDGIAMLVVGQYGNDPGSYPKPMDIYLYDTHDPDCTHLVHVPNPTNPVSKATYSWPRNIHNLTVSPDLDYVYATLPIQAADLKGMWRHVHVAHGTIKVEGAAAGAIVDVGNLNDAMNGAQEGIGPQNDIVPAEANPSRPLQADNVHEAWVDDNTTLYIGGQTPDGDIFSIVDVSRWLATDGKEPATPLAQWAGRGHSIRTATIRGAKYVLHSEESVVGTAYGCVPQEANPFGGPAQPWLTRIGDPAKPTPELVSQMGLEINEPQNCATQMNDKENDSVHYHDVDDPANTHFVMASMWNAGIRVFDVGHDPARPTEVAYFNPADIAPMGEPTKLDQAWGHVHYDAAKGNIWFATAYGGFYVVRIENQVRTQLGLSKPVVSPPATHLVNGKDAGWSGTKGITYRVPVAARLDATPYYCTLAPFTQRF